jgi:hypothetical protein
MKSITIDHINEEIVETDIDWLKGAYAEVDQETGQAIVFLNLKTDAEDEDELTPIVGEDDELEDEEDEEDDDEEDLD